MAEYKGAGDTVTINDVLEVCGKYITNQESIDLINQAYDFIIEKHEGQKRKSGEPYTIHLIWVAYILATLQTGPATIAAGLLHDVMEDCGVSREEMVERFGEEITTLVEGVTKIGKMPFKDESDVYAENHRKIYIAMAKDIRVILIKFADRLHNMRTLQFMPPHKQKRISRETLEVYTPIAHRLGINDIKTELEDLSLSYLDPVAYSEISKLLATKQEERKESVAKMMASVKQILDDNSYQYRILGRAKSIYSIYKKMFVKKKRFDELYDLYALRIITQDKMDCYGILGLIHDQYRPIPGRFKDYIAMPKPNMYQSLHTSVIGEDGNTFEIQIRTEEMDELAELGVAAHWRYKENKGYSSKKEQQEIGEKLQWLREFISLSDDIKDGDAKEYYDSLKRDIFEANVYVLTPQGKIVELPNGSTPIDFAYRIHTEVGHKAVGAIVNNVMVPIDTKLNTGDVVEIKTNKQSLGPSEDWLKFVRTAGARNKIRQFIANREAETKKETIEDGRKMLRDELKKRQLDEKKYMDPDTYKTYLGSFGARSFDDILYFIGKKSLPAMNLLDRVVPKKSGFFDSISKMLQRNNQVNEKQQSSRNNSGVVVKGLDGLRIQLSKCCNPIPGDDIMGFVSQGQGIKVHRRDCPNIQQPEIKARLIDVYWDFASISTMKFQADLEIVGLDRPNLLNDVVTSLGQMKINILNIHADVVDMKAIIKLKISVEDASRLQQAIDNIDRIQGIYEIKRVIH
ncbi:bifunctional (p)ppGpp synthetase/guanosine-3',5'-bis(diphosphate) 3'-pyrophosphohydrolase [Erysipelatoclostridium ramosum]|uniref:RelA/SpoT family protein n=1 Tax=Thomasclavelia ramosa TaxID=1547 RepID=UPI0018AC8921|nr:bifunctional (p)ppGpp synthetase/guanosine-3',5'-bis(diphosphate) 3'-pyrophosphohydrolase [Thomasclavelia ramosa]MDB7093295.1 bifunctional (p)ppGpp synthetase/guanosine-3',5'-bis(diphosphate) 3'-pyrophosphohydrolase [Thomasclavelia ramosa]